MKRIISIFLSLCVFSSIFCVTAASRSPVNIFNVTVTAPVAGAKPDYNASVPATASSYVAETKWAGTLDANGCFKSGTEYTVYVTVKLKDEYKGYI